MVHRQQGTSQRGHALLASLLAVPALALFGTATAEYGSLARHQATLTLVAKEASRVGAAQPGRWEPGPAATAEGVLVSGLAARGIGTPATLAATTTETTLTLRVAMAYTPLLGLLPTPSHVATEVTVPLAYAL